MNDPLAQLQDIQLPEQVHQYPIAPGWWLLLILVITLLAYCLYRYQKRKQLKQAQQQALSYARQANTNEQIMALFKSAALAYFPRSQVARLFGQEFYRFLVQQLPTKHKEKFSQLSEHSFNSAYQAQQTNTDSQTINQELHQALVLWLTYALPPKPNKQANTLTSEQNNKLEGNHV